MTLSEKRAVAVREIVRERAIVHGWLHHQYRVPLSASTRYERCRAIGIQAPGFVCVAGQRLVRAVALRRVLDAKLAARSPVQRHLAGWLCIHAREGAWNANTGNGYLGGLQMTPGWGGLARPDLATPALQIATAEREAAKVGWSPGWMSGQWPNTYPPCASYF
jgi:hypothetical protein